VRKTAATAASIVVAAATVVAVTAIDDRSIDQPHAPPCAPSPSALASKNLNYAPPLREQDPLLPVYPPPFPSLLQLAAGSSASVPRSS